LYIPIGSSHETGKGRNMKARKKQRGTGRVTPRERVLPSGTIQIYIDKSPFIRGKGRFDAFACLTGDPHIDSELRAKAFLKASMLDAEFRSRAKGIPNLQNLKSSFIAYMKGLAEKRASANTRASWGDAIDHLIAYAGHGITFEKLTPEFIEGFKDYLLNQVTPKKISPNSAQIYLSRIKTAILQAVRDNYLSRNPALQVNIKKQETLPVYLTIEEIRRLQKTPCANECVKNAFLFSCFSGLRVSDVDALTWDKIEKGYVQFTQIKTGKPERMPLSEQALRTLKKQRKTPKSPNIQRELPENSVFNLPRQSVVDKQLKAWALAAKISKPLSMHKARHTFATLSLSSGVDIYTTSKLLGHKSVQTTQRYAQVIDEKKREAVGKLPRI
jgi:site-specific recombinase XerD